MNPPPPDGSRDRRIEDPSNLFLVHPAGRRLLPLALRLGVSANLVSGVGLCLGIGAAIAYAQWDRWPFALLGLLLSAGWLIADGLDGMVARATGTASPLGRMLDGLVDHGVFLLLYLTLAWSVGTAGGWALAIAAGVAHAVQSSLFEGERARFHRRVKGIPAADLAAPPPANPLVRLYDSVAGSLDRAGRPFERALAAAPDRAAFGRAYGDRAAPTMKAMALLSANVRVEALFVACLIGAPMFFWWFEIVVLTLVAALTIRRHRQIEMQLAGVTPGKRFPLFSLSSSRKQGHP